MARRSDSPERRQLIEAVKLARAAGSTIRECARRFGTSDEFVRYHTDPSYQETARARRQRRRKRLDERVPAKPVPVKRKGATTVVNCVGCDNPREITVEALQKRERVGSGPYRCRSCIWRKRKGEPDLKHTHASPKPGAEWLTLEERERPKAWARRVAKTWTQAELAEVLGALESLVDSIRGEDDSSFARHPRRDKRREGFEPHPYAKLERPFGSKAAA